MLGRVLGVLLVSDPPERTAEELAGILKASRGSISAATRSLVQMGVVERSSLKETFFTYYEKRDIYT